MSYFTEMDSYLFGQGTHYEIYRKLGAHYVNEKGKNGKTNVLGFMVGQCMKASKGKGNPNILRDLITEAINKA